MRPHVVLRYRQRDVVETTLLCLIFKVTDRYWITALTEQGRNIYAEVVHTSSFLGGTNKSEF